MKISKIAWPDPMAAMAAVEVPVFLDLPSPKIRAYPVYTVVAEKFQAMVVLGLANSRMKDFYDIWRISRLMDLDGKLLFEAISAPLLC